MVLTPSSVSEQTTIDFQPSGSGLHLHIAAGIAILPWGNVPVTKGNWTSATVEFEILKGKVVSGQPGFVGEGSPSKVSVQAYPLTFDVTQDIGQTGGFGWGVDDASYRINPSQGSLTMVITVVAKSAYSEVLRIGYQAVVMGLL